MNPANIATAADYADAMLTARRAKRILTGLLLLMLAVQITLFVLVRTDVIQLPASPAAAATLTLPDSISATQPAEGAVDVTVTTRPVKSRIAPELLHYFIGLTVFFGIILAVVLAAVLMLILAIMLVGRLIGVSHVTSAFVWCVFLAALLFPWQAFLNNANLTGEFKIPGVLYTWEELVRHAHFDTQDTKASILKWARFVGFPVVAMIVTLMVSIKSARGLRMALGESEVSVDIDETRQL